MVVVAVVVALEEAVVKYDVGVSSLVADAGIGAGLEEVSKLLAVVEADTAAVVDGEQQQLQWRPPRRETLGMSMK